MWEQSYVTRAGAALLDQWLAGDGMLTVDSARAGAGTVPASELPDCIELADERQTLSIVGMQRSDQGTKYSVQFPAADDGYTVHQIGLWAHVDGGESVLFAVYQDDVGVAIPPKEEMSDFSFTFHAIVKALGTTGNLQVVTDPEAYVTHQQMQAYVGAAIQQHNSSPDAHGGGIGTGGSSIIGRIVIAERTRESWRPDFGLGGGRDGMVALEAEPYTGIAEIGVVISGTQYDARNMTQNDMTAQSGDLILTRLER